VTSFDTQFDTQLDTQIVPRSAIPQHIAIIMDGNNRWAQRRGLSGVAGHRAGVEVVRTILEACDKRGVKVLTLFAFSSENWGRPEPEVRALMALLSRYLRREAEKLHRDNIRVRFIGRRDRISTRQQRLLERAEQLTEANTGATLVLAIDYGGRWDVVDAAKRMAIQVHEGRLQPSDIDEERLNSELALGDVAPPDLCIRTGGDQRISNFLLWQFAYAELYFTERLWPDFDAAALDEALQAFASRERRFGLRGSAETDDLDARFGENL